VGNKCAATRLRTLRGRPLTQKPERPRCRAKMSVREWLKLGLLALAISTAITASFVGIVMALK
jgi:hypothetical protein